MKAAINAARANPDAPFGCVIADDAGQILARGCNDAADDPTAHGEIVAIRSLRARRDGGSDIAGGLTLCTTAEPCAMCMGAILWAGIGTVVWGTDILTLSAFGFRQIGLSARVIAAAGTRDFGECRCVGGVLADSCDALFRAAGR